MFLDAFFLRKKYLTKNNSFRIESRKLLESIRILICSFVFLAVSWFPGNSYASIPNEVHTLNEYHFTASPGLKSKVEFWKKIYSEYSTKHAVIHDIKNLNIIYEVVYLGEKRLSRKARERKLGRVKKRYRNILRKIAKTKNKLSLKGEDKRVFKLVKNNFYKASRHIRAQLGQKDRFRKGIERSGLYLVEIKRILKQYGLPEELSVLPHVESSFQIGAYSSAGAAGIWQFTRSTGRLFMRVGYDVDERRDPILATYGAAKLLKRNFESLNSWPLAITAYNHGLQGMRRAQKKFGNDFVKVVAKYKSRTFGFASQNFYAEFLAAIHVIKNQNKYFPNLVIKKPIKITSFSLPDYIGIRTAMNYFEMSRDEIAAANPSLRRPVLNGEKRIPKGFHFQAPAEKVNNMVTRYGQIPQKAKYGSQLRSKWYTVRRGDTLSGVAQRFRASLSSLKSNNNIGRRNRIYVGQVLQLPRGKSSRQPSYQLTNLGSKNVSPKNYSAKVLFYKVRRHDNLSKIAKRFNTDVRHLKGINRFRNPDTLYPGQRIKVPSQEIVNEAMAFKGVKSRNFNLTVDRSKVVTQKKIATSKIAMAVLTSSLKGTRNSSESINRNRPAFKPVSFSPDANSDSNIGTITVDFDETLSHYAEWSLLSVRELRRINRIGRKGAISINDKLRVNFSKTLPSKFDEKRQEYHKAIQEDFFNNYEISKLTIRSVEKGETLWEMRDENYTIPLWLLSSYNSDKDIRSLSVGEPVVIPIIIPKDKNA
jgi:membrane-bound lytic murein transglycosylase D